MHRHRALFIWLSCDQYCEIIKSLIELIPQDRWNAIAIYNIQNVYLCFLLWPYRFASQQPRIRWHAKPQRKEQNRANDRKQIGNWIESQIPTRSRLLCVSDRKHVSIGCGNAECNFEIVLSPVCAPIGFSNVLCELWTPNECVEISEKCYEKKRRRINSANLAINSILQLTAKKAAAMKLRIRVLD